MREIKFRLWSIHSKKMFGCERNFYLSLDGDIFRSDDLDYMNKSSFEVMQYTGLKDKNGKEIYEGDIIQNDRGSYLQVSYGDGAYMVKGVDALNKRRFVDYLHEFNNWSEVKGNIYENHELLGEDERNDFLPLF